MSWMRLVSSAMGMNSAGGTMLPSLRCQRSSASMPDSAPLSTRYCG